MLRIHSKLNRISQKLTVCNVYIEIETNSNFIAANFLFDILYVPLKKLLRWQNHSILTQGGLLD